MSEVYFCTGNQGHGVFKEEEINRSKENLGFRDETIVNRCPICNKPCKRIKA